MPVITNNSGIAGFRTVCLVVLLCGAFANGAQTPQANSSMRLQVRVVPAVTNSTPEPPVFGDIQLAAPVRLAPRIIRNGKTPWHSEAVQPLHETLLRAIQNGRAELQTTVIVPE
jgi:hypothetical protein